MFSVSMPAAASVTWSLVRTNGCGVVTLTGTSEGRPVLASVLRPVSSIQRSVADVQSPTQLPTLIALTLQSSTYQDVSSPRSPSSVSVNVDSVLFTSKLTKCQPDVSVAAMRCT